MKKKGQILVLDVTLAIVIVAMIITASLYFYTKASEDYINHVQMVRIGSDIVNVLEKDGTIDSLDPQTIKASIEELLPINYGMRLKINTTASQGMVIAETEQTLAENKFITTGKRFFAFESGGTTHSGSIKYEVWLK